MSRIANRNAKVLTELRIGVGALFLIFAQYYRELAIGLALGRTTSPSVDADLFVELSGPARPIVAILRGVAGSQ